jgi:hypothetical protein
MRQRGSQPRALVTKEQERVTWGTISRRDIVDAALRAVRGSGFEQAIRHDRSKEHGALATPHGRPRKAKVA